MHTFFLRGYTAYPHGPKVHWLHTDGVDAPVCDHHPGDMVAPAEIRDPAFVHDEFLAHRHTSRVIFGPPEGLVTVIPLNSELES